MGAWEQPVLIKRSRRVRVEAQRDREFLGWIARFRFVTVDVLSERFSVSVRQANARVSGLEAARLVVCVGGQGQRRAIFVSRRGTMALGLSPRRPPRPEVQREHELAIAHLAARIELERPGAHVLTEREGRRQEAAGGRRCSADVRLRGGRRQKRWPDLIVETDDHRIAVELELAAKTTERLREIVIAYAVSRDFTEVQFLAGSSALAARLERLCARERRPPLVGDRHRMQLTAAPWPGAPEPERRRIEVAIADASPLSRLTRPPGHARAYS